MKFILCKPLSYFVSIRIYEFNYILCISIHCSFIFIDTHVVPSLVNGNLFKFTSESQVPVFGMTVVLFSSLFSF